MARPKGGYKFKDGKPATGVTTILGRFKDSGGLIWWAYTQGQAQERGEIIGLYDKRDEAADAGTLAHDLVEAHILGKNPEDLLIGTEKPLVVAQAMNAYYAYRQWEQQTKLEIFETEVPLVSEKYRFAGCIDAIGKHDGKLILLDWKSGKGVYTDAIYQLGGYKILWNENFPSNPITGGAHLVRFDKEFGDFHHHYWPDLTDAERVFLMLNEAFVLDKKTKKRIK